MTDDSTIEDAKWRLGDADSDVEMFATITRTDSAGNVVNRVQCVYIYTGVTIIQLRKGERLERIQAAAITNKKVEVWTQEEEGAQLFVASLYLTTHNHETITFGAHK